MSIMRWDPTRELAAAQSEMRRMLEVLGISGGEGSGQRSGGWLPAMDVREEGNEIVVEMELAGVRPEDVDIEIENGALTVSGERQQQQRAEDRRQIRVERRFGRFTRTLPLPPGIDDGSIKAELRDGLLELRIPTPEEPKPRRVELRSSGSSRTIDSGGGDNSREGGSSTAMPDGRSERSAPSA
jgi:HSP20 family protein